MMSRARGRRRLSLRRAAVIGFVLGFVITLPAVYLALLLPVGERLLPLLTPGAQLLRPLAPLMSSWPGAINLLLASVANGLVFALLLSGIAILSQRRPVIRR